MTDDATPVQVTLGEFPPAPSAYTEDAVLLFPGLFTELRATYEHEGSLWTAGIQFEKVRAYRYRAEGHCTSWHFEAYDRLVEVVPSEWVAELISAEPEESWGTWTIRHFLIFIDSVGAFEIAAEAFAWLPGEPAAP